MVSLMEQVNFHGESLLHERSFLHKSKKSKHKIKQNVRLLNKIKINKNLTTESKSYGKQRY